MILADTSVWVEHLRRHSNSSLEVLLNAGRVLMHPFILGELALGNLGPRRDILQSLQRLPQANTANNDEVLELIERHRLHGRGIGYVDAHLLASALLTAGASFWTHDGRLQSMAAKIGIAYSVRT